MYIVCRHVRASFSSETVQAGEVKGLMSAETQGLLRTGRRGKGIEMGEIGRLYTCRYTVTTRMTPALRRATMRAVLMFD